MNESHGKNTEARIFFVISSVVLGVFLFWLLCINTVSPGYVGVVNNLLGDEKGIQPDIKAVGIHVTAPWKTIYLFPVFEQNHAWEEDESFNFQTSEGMSILAEVGITYHLKPESVPLIFQKYRRGMHEITNIIIRNYIRDAITKAASKFKSEDLYSNGKESFFEHVEKNIREQLEPIGIIVSRIYWLSFR